MANDLTQLTTDVTDFLVHSEWTTAKVATFAKLARMALERIYRPKFLRVLSTGIAVSGNTFILPSDVGVIEVVRLHDGSAIRLLDQKDEAIVRRLAQTSAQTPIYYRSQNSVTLAYSPASGSTVDLLYRKNDTDLVNATDTNAWSTNAYDVLFYATCARGALYDRDGEAMQSYLALAKEMLTDIEHDDIANTESDRFEQMSEDLL